MSPVLQNTEAMPRLLRVVWVLWPAFLVACVLEVLLFASWDPLEMRWFGHAVQWSRDTAYSVCFFVLWGACATSAWLTLVLCGGWERLVPTAAPIRTDAGPPSGPLSRSPN